MPSVSVAKVRSFYKMLVTGVEGVKNCVGDKFELLVTVLAPKIGSRDRPYRS